VEKILQLASEHSLDDDLHSLMRCGNSFQAAAAALGLLVGIRRVLGTISFVRSADDLIVCPACSGRLHM